MTAPLTTPVLKSDANHFCGCQQDPRGVRFAKTTFIWRFEPEEPRAHQ